MPMLGSCGRGFGFRSEKYTTTIEIATMDIVTKACSIVVPCVD